MPREREDASDRFRSLPDPPRRDQLVATTDVTAGQDSTPDVDWKRYWATREMD